MPVQSAVRSQVIDLRRAILNQLAPALDYLVTTPGISVELPTLAGLRLALDAYEKLVLCVHTSSSASYAFADAGADEESKYQRAKHLLDVLDLLHGPQNGDGTCAGGC